MAQRVYSWCRFGRDRLGRSRSPPISDAHLTNQVFLVFVLGGMMLGAASLLAPRPEAYLAFLIPTGFLPTVRLLVQGDQMHLAMGVLAAVFTFATLMTTGRIYN